jgi:broad specificity phosphatase PhoE
LKSEACPGITLPLPDGRGFELSTAYAAVKRQPVVAHYTNSFMPLAPEGKIILVRHGETEANRRKCFAESDDIPLTDTGRRQAHELAARLAREFHPQILCSSKFARARETSAIIAGVLGLQPETIPGIHERDFGVLRGHSYDRLAEAMAADPLFDPARSWRWRPAGGESLEDVRNRSIAALGATRARHPGKDIVIVCHGAVIQAICAQIAGEWRESFVPPNCGVVEIEYKAGHAVARVSATQSEEEAILTAMPPKASPEAGAAAAKPFPPHPQPWP